MTSKEIKTTHWHYLLSATESPKKNLNQGVNVDGDGKEHWYYGRKIRWQEFEMNAVIMDNGEFALNYMDLPEKNRAFPRNMIKDDFEMEYDKGMIYQDCCWSKAGYEPFVISKTDGLEIEPKNENGTAQNDTKQNSVVSVVGEVAGCVRFVKPKLTSKGELCINENSNSLTYPETTLTTLTSPTLLQTALHNSLPSISETTLKYPTTTLNYTIEGPNAPPSEIKLEFCLGKDLFDTLLQVQDYYMDVHNPIILKFTTAWALATHCFELFPAFGYLFLNSDPETGKTKFAEIITNLSFNPNDMTSPSESVLFRIIEQTKGTMLIDDFENLPEEKQATLEQILKVGYKKGGRAARAEKRGDDYVPTFFDVYCPKLITNTTTVNRILLTRCIPIHLMKTATTKGKYSPDFNDPTWQFLRDCCHNFVMENWRAIRQAYEEIDIVDLNNRFLELVKPVLAVAKVIDKSYYEELKTFAVEAFTDRTLIDVSQSWEYVLFSEIYLHCPDKEEWVTVKAVQDWVQTKLLKISGKGSDDTKTPGTRWVGGQLSNVPILKKRRKGSGIEYLLSESLAKKILESKGFPVPENENKEEPPEIITPEREVVQ